MNKIFLLALLCLIFSCGKKVNTSQNLMGENLLSLEKSDLDQDYDGISDQEEIKLGLDPLKADLPQINLKLILEPVFHFKLFDNSHLEYIKKMVAFEKRPQSKIDRRRAFAAKLAYRELYHLEKNWEITTFDDLLTQPLSCMTKQEIYGELQKLRNQFLTSKIDSQNITFQYQVEIGKMKSLKSVEDVQFQLNVNNKTLSQHKLPRNKYQFENGNTDFKEIHEFDFFSNENKAFELLDGDNNCLEYQWNNFSYTVGDKKLDYLSQKQVIAQNNAHFIILKNGHLNESSYAIKDLNVSDFIKEKNINIETSINGNLLSVDGVANEFIHLSDLDLTKENEQQKRNWFFFASDGSKLYEKIKPGVVYIIANLSVSDILKHATSKQELKDVAVDEVLQLSEIYAGDRIEIASDVFGQINALKAFNQIQDGFVLINIPMSSSQARLPAKNAGCFYEELNQVAEIVRTNYKIEQEDTFDLTIQVGSTKRKVYPIKKAEKLFYEFEVNSNDLVNDQLQITFTTNSFRVFPYRRIMRRRDQSAKLFCEKSGRTNSEQYKVLEATKRLDYILDIKRFGILR